MTALTKNVNRTEKEGKLLAMPVGVAKVFHNALMMINAAGFVVPCADVAGSAYAGMAYEAVDNSAGVAGDEVVRLDRHSAIEIEGAGFAAADLGKVVYAADDNTVQLAAGANLVKVGIIVKVISATKVLVKQDTTVAKA